MLRLLTPLGVDDDTLPLSTLGSLLALCVVASRNVGGWGFRHPVPRHFRLGYTGRMATKKNPKKVEKVMKEYKAGELHSGSKTGPVVKSKKQAVAIAMSEAGMSKKKGKK